MKIKLLLVLTFLFSCLGCSREKELVLIGDSFVLSNLDGGESSFVINKMTSQNLYYFLDKNAVSMTNDIDINSLIKKSNKIIFSFGIYDIIPYFDFTKDVDSYNKTLLDNKIELFDYYSYRIFEFLNEHNKTNKFYFVKQVDPLIGNSNKKEVNYYLEKVNNILYKYSLNYSMNFIDIGNVSSYLIDDFVFDKQIKNIIYDLL